ncbi:hypothetical protein SSX86_030217 [Deinandra increscens subsp. villosa]|uniref:Transposase-associated domain-containing protein n=1 Tax=Deinandra increscens subsp. villosa TaxID=3103831 RepID=A0AAP0CCA3_9ASTR
MVRSTAGNGGGRGGSQGSGQGSVRASDRGSNDTIILQQSDSHNRSSIPSPHESDDDESFVHAYVGRGPASQVQVPVPINREWIWITYNHMAWYIDRRWMYEMTNSDGFANRVYFDNVDFFLDFAFSNEAVVDTRVTMNGEMIRDIKCPCYKCQNVSYRDRNTDQRHLYKEGFMLHYTTWHEHGESSTMEVDDNDDGYKQMVLDNMYSCGYTSNTLEGHVPNPKAKRFYDMLEAVDEPLWEGKKATCSTKLKAATNTKLKAATNFLTWKSLFNVSTTAYNYNISMVNALMPEENKLPKGL